MNNLYIIGGVALILFGIWLTFVQAKTLLTNKKENPKVDYKGLGIGIFCILLGLAVIFRFVQ